MSNFTPKRSIVINEDSYKDLPFSLFHDLNICIGRGTKFGQNVVVEEGVHIGQDCFIGSNSVIRSEVIMGDQVIIGHLVVVEAKTLINKDSTIQSKCYVAAYCFIGSNVFLGPNVTMTNDVKMIKYHKRNGEEFKPNGPTFCNGCRVGAGSVILPGVNIGKNSIVGAGSVVTKSVPEGETWIGPSAKQKEKWVLKGNE